MQYGGSLSSLGVADLYPDLAFGDAGMQPAASVASAPSAPSQSSESPQAIVTALVISIALMLAIRILYEMAEG